MANQEQVELLLSGVDKWNAWREENPGVRIDLVKADLTKRLSFLEARRKKETGAAAFTPVYINVARLSSVNFRDADLRGARLQSAHLQNADLQSADLRKTDLRKVSFFRANLIRADLREANLRGANLDKTILNGTDLRGADLREISLKGAELTKAIVDISNYALCVQGKGIREVQWHLDNEMRALVSEGVSITRSIYFDPEYKRAGVQILSDFAYIVESKYPGRQVKVTIEQEGLLVIMKISAPTGELLEQTEQDLKLYGKVVIGSEQPEALLSSPTAVMRLKHQLDYATILLKHEREMRQMEVRLLQEKHESVKDEVKQLRFDARSMRKHLGQSLTNQHQLSESIRALAAGQIGLVEAAVQSLESAVLSGDHDSANQALDIIQSEEPQLLTRLKAMAQKVSESGVTHMLKKLIDAWQEGL